VVVIEHDLDVIKSADWIIDLGPGAGHHGGQVLFAGAPRQLLRSTRSLTARYLRRHARRASLGRNGPRAGGAPPGAAAAERACCEVTVWGRPLQSAILPPFMEKASPKGSRSFARVAEMHATGNRRSKDDWDLYRGHREQFTATLLGLIPEVTPADRHPTLCLLGAGNCNDVDLSQLADQFGMIHLVDIDAGALSRARERQPAAIRPQLVLHGGVDLTGLLGPLDRWKGKTPDAATLVQAVSEGVAQLARLLPAGQVDLAVSCCLMSQLGWSLETALGPIRPAGGDVSPSTSLELRLATITVHLQTLATLTRPGGKALLASDIVSSDLYPLDELAPDTDLRALADRLVAEQAVVYAGANPLLVSRLLRKDPALKQAFTGPTILPPWLWQGQFDRTYLVYPQLLRRV
jgi:hypothetical protein